MDQLDKQTNIEAAFVVEDQLLGTTISARYLLKDRVGYGGWGVVYRGTDLTLDREVAIKVLHLPLAGKSEQLNRFIVEARATSQVLHENIVTIFDYGAFPNGQPFLVMEYLEGESLATRLKRGPIPLKESAAIFRQLCDALHCAHAKGILHRDIKPSNIFISRAASKQAEVTKLLDFGLAKFVEGTEDLSQLTRTGETVGSPAYMSPEQCSGHQLDPRSDLYSLCCALYETLCGQKVYSGNAFVCMHAHLNDQPTPIRQVAPDLGLPQSVELFLEKGLSKKPARRFQSATEFKESLNKAIEGRVGFIKRIRFRLPTEIVAGLLALGLVVAVLAATGRLSDVSQKVANFFGWVLNQFSFYVNDRRVTLEYRVMQAPSMQLLPVQSQSRMINSEFFNFFQEPGTLTRHEKYDLSVSMNLNGTLDLLISDGDTSICDLGAIDKLPDTVRDPSFYEFERMNGYQIQYGHCYLIKVMPDFREQSNNFKLVVLRAIQDRDSKN